MFCSHVQKLFSQYSQKNGIVFLHVLFKTIWSKVEFFILPFEIILLWRVKTLLNNQKNIRSRNFVHWSFFRLFLVYLLCMWTLFEGGASILGIHIQLFKIHCFYYIAHIWQGLECQRGGGGRIFFSQSLIHIIVRLYPLFVLRLN